MSCEHHLVAVPAGRCGASGERIAPLRRALLMIGMALLAACSLAPDHRRPDLPVANAWPVGPAYTAQPSAATASDSHVAGAEVPGWRHVFTDPGLRQVIEIALAHNRDLRVATLNVAAAEARYRAQRSDLLPKLSLNGNAVIQGLPDNDVLDGTPGVAAAGRRGVSQYYALGGGITAFELDLFGRASSLSTQAFEQHLSTAAARRGAMISLMAQTATIYLDLAAERAKLRLAERTLANQQAASAVVQSSFGAGGANALAVRQADTAVQTAAASKAQSLRLVAQYENALTEIVGANLPPDILARIELDDRAFVTEVPAGLPSDVLTNRPDVVAAEHALRAANASIGAARAAFFPSITLTGAGGLQSSSLGALFAGAATGWSFAPQIMLPIFSVGRNQAELDLAKISKDIGIAQYEKTIQTAFREVSDGLAARGTFQEQLQAQKSLIAAYSEAYRLAEQRYRAGLDNYMPTLDAQRQLYLAQQAFISLQRGSLASAILLYKALGGGYA